MWHAIGDLVRARAVLAERHALYALQYTVPFFAPLLDAAYIFGPLDVAWSQLCRALGAWDARRPLPDAAMHALARARAALFTTKLERDERLWHAWLVRTFGAHPLRMDQASWSPAMRAEWAERVAQCPGPAHLWDFGRWTRGQPALLQQDPRSGPSWRSGPPASALSLPVWLAWDSRALRVGGTITLVRVLLWWLWQAWARSGHQPGPRAEEASALLLLLVLFEDHKMVRAIHTWADHAVPLGTGTLLATLWYGGKLGRPLPADSLPAALGMPVLDSHGIQSIADFQELGWLDEGQALSPDLVLVEHPLLVYWFQTRSNPWRDALARHTFYIVRGTTVADATRFFVEWWQQQQRRPGTGSAEEDAGTPPSLPSLGALAARLEAALRGAQVPTPQWITQLAALDA